MNSSTIQTSQLVAHTYFYVYSTCGDERMTYDQFLAELGKANLTVRGFANLIGMNRNSVSNYAGRANIPHHLALIAALLAEMTLAQIDYGNAISRVGSGTKKPRGRAKPGRFGGDRQELLELN
jgi:hypothetical protein